MATDDAQDKPAGEGSAGAADAKGKAKAKKKGQIADETLQAKPVGFGQQLLIFTLIIVVGVLFGSPYFLSSQIVRPQPDAFDIKRSIAEKHGDVEARLIRAGVFRGYPKSWEGYARDLWLAREADKEGLMPGGETLDKIVEEFLKADVGGGKTRRDILNALEGKRRVQPKELREWLGVQFANINLTQKYSATPVCTSGAQVAFDGLQNDKVEVAMVRLTTKPLIEKHKAAVTDDEIAAEYQKQRTIWFKVPAQREVVGIYPDTKQIAEHVFIKEERIQAYYDSEKALKPSWRIKDEPAEDKPDDDKPAEPPKPKEPKYKPLAEVKAEIIEELKEQEAKRFAKLLYDGFMNTVHEKVVELGIQQKVHELPFEELQAIAATAMLKAADHEGLAKDVGMTVSAPTKLSQPEEEGAATVTFAELGDVKVPATVFKPDTQQGQLLEAPLVSGFDLPPVVLRLQGYEELSYKEQGEVAEELRTYLAARKAYTELLTKAAELQEAAAVAGGLDTYFGQEANAKQWETEVDKRNLGANPLGWQGYTIEALSFLDDVVAPAETLDAGTGTESQRLIGLARPDRPIFIGGSFRSRRGDDIKLENYFRSQPEQLTDVVPEVVLVQVIDYQRADAKTEGRIDAETATNNYRSMIMGFQQQLVFASLLDRATEE